MAKKKEVCDVCGGEYKNVNAHKYMAHDYKKNIEREELRRKEREENRPPEDEQLSGLKRETGDDGSAGKNVDNGGGGAVSEIMGALRWMKESIEGISKRLDRVETGDKYAFKDNAKPEDLKKGALDRASIQDPRVVRIVDEVLGEDFGVRMAGNGDRPGFRLDIIVPHRLSPLPQSERPVKKADPTNPRDYVRNPDGSLRMENYFPEDVRSRQLSSTDSYEVIRDHCLKVQANIISWHQKLSKPIPEFRVR